MAVGWIKLHRKIQECILWDDDEPFDRRSAWIDLLLLANHEDKKTLFNGEAITVKSGQRITSIRKLAERWHWTKNRVERFLDLLVSEGMILKDSDARRTLLTLVNYGNYQGSRDSNEDTDEDTERTATGQQRGQQRTTNKNIKNIKNEKNEKKEIKRVYGDYHHVLLTEGELQKLLDEYGEPVTQDAIRFLDEYIEDKKYKANSHYLCIRRWVISAVEEHKAKNNSKNKVADRLEDDYDWLAEWGKK